MTYNQQTPAANKKMTDYQPPSYEELRVENQNLKDPLGV